jgi:hypothetical protein
VLGVVLTASYLKNKFVTEFLQRALDFVLERQEIVTWIGLIWLRIEYQWRALVNTII